MKLYTSPASPFARKVWAVAIESGFVGQLELISAQPGPVQTDMDIVAYNPLAQVPTAVLADGRVLFDSRVICEYIDAHQGAGLFPQGPSRWPALVLHALADGVMDAALLARYEQVTRPEELQWDDWQDGLMRKIGRSLDTLDAQVPEFAQRVHIGTIALACALGYLDFRFPELDWRQGRGQLNAWFKLFGARPSMTDSSPA